MPVIMTLTSANAAIQILASAMKALNAAREHSKASKDTDLKADINTLYDELLALKEAVIRVTDENAQLRRALAQQAEKPPEPEPRQVGNVNYYFVGDKGPYCQPCYDVNHRLALLAPQVEYTGGRGRKCEACKTIFFETGRSQARLEVRRV
jgi:hypothetical protein